MQFSEKPMMSQAEIDLLDEQIDKHKPASCLEWGAGGSTIYFPKKHKCIKRWISIEHVGQYAEWVGSRVASNVTVLWVLGVSYVDCIKLQPHCYDFVLVDGTDRIECLNVSRDVIKPKGNIYFHDSAREMYDKGIVGFDGKREVLCDGEEPDKTGRCKHRGITRFYIS